MRKIIQAACVAVSLMSAGSAHAQLSAGHILVGGGGGFSSSRPEDQNIQFRNLKNSSGFFSPQVGYFLLDNLAVGLNFHYSATENVTTQQIRLPDDAFGTLKTTSTNKTMLAGPFVRYYKPLGEKAAIFGQLGVGFGGSKRTTKYDGQSAPVSPDDVKFGIINAGLTPGFAYFPTKRFGLEIMTSAIRLGYDRRRQKDLPAGAKEEDYTTSSFTAQADLRSLFILGNIQIGATFYLGGE